MSKPFASFIHGISKAYWKIKKPRTLGIRAMIFDENKEKILLVKHTYIDGWFLPGGGVKKFEKPLDALKRELREELGFSLESSELFGVYSNFAESKSDTIIVMICTGDMSVKSADKEIEEARFFELSKLPNDISGGTKRRIEEYTAGKSHMVAKW